VIQKEYEAEAEKRKKIQELKPVVVRIIPVNYQIASTLSGKIQKIISPKGTVEFDERTNSIIIRDIEENALAAEDLVKKLDMQTPQILIEARIVEARTTFAKDIGVQLGGQFAMSPKLGNETGLVFPSTVGIAGGATDGQSPTAGLFLSNPSFAVNLPAPAGTNSGGAIGITLGSIGGAANLSLRLSAAEEEGKVKIITSPKISTMDNEKATIQQGISIPISTVSAAGVNTQFFNADLKLEVQPHVTRDGFVSMRISITKNEPDFGNVAANGNPTIQKKEAQTNMLVKDGDTSVIGGILQTNKSDTIQGIPFLSKIPILGWFFEKKKMTDDKMELLIFITPRIVNRQAALVQGQ
jgi:type IV pilus assembly protein PilQ